jgi:uncharacterized membrane protein YhaH (DUF805 family)
MDSANPFAPPVALVRDLAPAETAYQPIQLWSIKGRMGRLRYLLYATVASMLAGIANIFVTLLASVLVTSAGLPWWTLMVLPSLVWLACTVFTVMLLVQRSHDMGWSGWTLLAALIPLVGLLWLFKAGTPGENRYGAPPPPNTTGVKVFAWILLVFAVLTVVSLMAAVSLPAYQQYVKRAQAVKTP